MPRAPVAKKEVKTKDPSKKRKPATKGKEKEKKPKAPLIDKSLYGLQPKVPSIGGVQPKRDLYHYVKWPRYIRIQKQRAVLMRRLKIPPAINQFKRVLNSQHAHVLFKLMEKYRPEDRKAAKKRLLQIAERRAKGEWIPEDFKATHRPTLIHGAQQVVKAIEKKIAKLVLIASDVDPVELVVSIPALCRKLDIPYMIVNDKARLGSVVRRKHTAAVAFTKIHKEHLQRFGSLVTIAKDRYNNNVEHRKQWGGGKGPSNTVIRKKQQIVVDDAAKKAKTPTTA